MRDGEGIKLDIPPRIAGNGREEFFAKLVVTHNDLLTTAIDSLCDMANDSRSLILSGPHVIVISLTRARFRFFTQKSLWSDTHGIC